KATSLKWLFLFLSLTGPVSAFPPVSPGWLEQRLAPAAAQSHFAEVAFFVSIAYWAGFGVSAGFAGVAGAAA
ncbi:hypothetical protein CPA58_29640, partial [Klebsiella pneumoniae]